LPVDLDCYVELEWHRTPQYDDNPLELEFYGALGLINDNDPLHAQQHYVFPVLRGELPRGIEYNFGPGIGLTRGSHRVIVKFNLELEHFIGALF